MEGKEWYVLRVKGGSEKKVGKILTHAGFEVCVPTQKEIHQWSDRKKGVEVAIFSRYVFICLSDKERGKIFIDKNIFGYLRICEKACILRANEIALIKKLDLVEEKVVISGEKVEKGAEIEILSGVLLGFCGLVKESGSAKKIRIEIESLNCFAEVVLGNVLIKRLA